MDKKTMQRDRPYIGQDHTDHGERGKTLITGITFRDLRDCYVRACFLSASHINPDGYAEADKGEDANLDENNLFDLNFDRIDPVAIAQNLSCEVEKLMGIFPNITKAANDGS
jgi:hypothetical protein